MDSENNNQDESVTTKEVEKSEIDLQFHWYLLVFFLIYFMSYCIPCIIGFYYIMKFLRPEFLNVYTLSDIMNSTAIFYILFTPALFILLYLMHLFLLAMTTKVCWAITERASPSKDGIIPRNIPSKTLNYYHIRSFMIKYGKYKFIKGLFPWLANWYFNTVGSDNISKGSTIEEQVCADKYIRLGENSYIGVNSGLTSHLIEGIFGNVVNFEINIGNDVTMAGMDVMGPGCEVKDNSWLLPLSGGGKHYVIKGKGFYLGAPMRKVFKKKVMNYLQLTEEDLERNDQMMKQKNEIRKQKQQKKEAKNS